VLGALVILWAIVLVPMWLRRHDRSNEVAAADRFAGAMRVLSRRPNVRARRDDLVGENRVVMAPPRSPSERAPHVTVSEAEDFEVSGPSRYAALAAEGKRRIANTRALTARYADDERGRSRPTRERPLSRSAQVGLRSRHIAKRRRLVILMAVAFVLSLAVAGLRGGLFIGLQVFVDILVLAGLAHLRAEALADRALARRGSARPAQKVAPRVAGPRVAEPQAAPARVAPARVAQPPVAEPAPIATRTPDPQRVASAVVGEMRPASATASVYATARARRTESAAEAATVAPRPTRRAVAQPAADVPAVAKTTAPAVRPPRATRTVDLTQPGKWSEQHTAASVDVSTSRYVTGELVADQRAERTEIEMTSDFDLDLILDRAVGE
jgi:hypothetical protein